MAEHSPATTHSPKPGQAASGQVASGQVAGHTEQAPHGAAFPPFESHTFLGQLIWLALAFGLLYYLMSKVALPRIEGILHDRANRLAADLDEAHRMKAEADAAGEAYERSLREAQAKAQGIAQEARNWLAAESDRARKAQEAALNEKLVASEETIRASTAAAMSNVGQIATEAASAIVERLTGKTPDRASLERALSASGTRH